MNMPNRPPKIHVCTSKRRFWVKIKLRVVHIKVKVEAFSLSVSLRNT